MTYPKNAGYVACTPDEIDAAGPHCADVSAAAASIKAMAATSDGERANARIASRAKKA